MAALGVTAEAHGDRRFATYKSKQIAPKPEAFDRSCYPYMLEGEWYG
jgi:hypothetical protein